MNYNLIIIDDELNQLRQLKNIVDWNALGFNITGMFSDVEKAMEFFKNNEVSVILSDIKMHGLSGLDLAKYCYYHYPSTKIVFMSAFKDFEYAQQALQCNVYSYLLKPLSADIITREFTKLYNAISTAKTESGDRWNSILENSHQLFCMLMTQQSDLYKITNLLNDAGIFIDPNDCHTSVINVKIIDSAKYFSNIWYHGKERLITALSRIISAETPVWYCVLINFIYDSFNILILSKQDIAFKTFRKNIYEYTEQLHDMLLNTLSMTTSVNVRQISENLSGLNVASPAANAPISDKALDDVLKYINEHYNEDIALTEIASLSGFNPVYFSSLFKKKTGVTFVDYLTGIRIDHAKKLLKDTNLKISQISAMVGYNYNSYFSKTFKNITGYLPNEYRSIHKKA